MYKSLLIAFVLTLAALAGPVGAEDKPSYTPAQLALFDTPHLQNIARPGTLTYRFDYQGPGDQSFADEVKMSVTAIAADGGKDLSFQYLTGERQQPFGDVQGFQGNPLIMLFLQSDVNEMGRLTGGGASYLRNGIRRAFRATAALEATKVEHEGKSLAAKRVVIRPFVDDPQKAQMGALADKSYEFLLVPDLPGGLYRIQARIPAGIDGSPAIESRLTFVGSDM